MKALYVRVEAEGILSCRFGGFRQTIVRGLGLQAEGLHFMVKFYFYGTDIGDARVYL
jgi:regulator of protease activity HflC (stomatin/prohibitin superfamily)